MSAPGTAGRAYADRLERVQRVWWKRVLPVQLPYRTNVRRQRLGRTLDVGCGIGRMLGALPAGSLGVDHNADAVAVARSQGLEAVTTDAFLAGPLAVPGSFDGLLLSHVVEHLTRVEAVALLRTYLPCVRPGGTVLVVCPQERGYASDPTHVWFATEAELIPLLVEVGLVVERSWSFPFPRRLGRWFVYNESCVRARVP